MTVMPHFAMLEEINRDEVGGSCHYRSDSILAPFRHRIETDDQPEIGSGSCDDARRNDFKQWLPMEFGKLASTQTSSRQLKNTVGGLILLSHLFRLDRMVRSM